MAQQDVISIRGAKQHNLKNVDLDLPKNKLVVITGLSGSGKSSLLAYVAGFLDTRAFKAQGAILIDGVDVTHAAVNDRDVTLALESYALYPHMTVRENMGFALKMKGVARDTIASKVTAAAKTCGAGLDTPWKKLPAPVKKKLLHGIGGEKIKVAWGNADSGSHGVFAAKFEGILPQVERLYRDTSSEQAREGWKKYMRERPCAACEGRRLRPESLAVLVAGAIGTYVWALQHWFVGVDDEQGQEQVAVFRGLDVSLLGLDLFRVDRDADLPVADLTAAARNRVRGGITADDSDDAARIVSALRDQRLQPCPTAEDEEPADTAAPTPTPTPTPGAAPSTPAVPGTPGSSTPESSAASRTSAGTTSSSRPGVDCREVE